MTSLNTKERRLPMLKVSSFKNEADEDTTAAAFKRKENALSSAGIKSSKFVANMCATIPHQVITTDAGGTMAVTMSGDGTKFLLIDPHFTVALETERDVLFILYHECLHLLLRHLQRDPERRADPVWTLACEAIINAVVMSRLGTRDMPRIVVKRKDGTQVTQSTGVDPRKVHAEYKKKAEEAGLTPVTYDKFVESEESMYSELKRLPDPPSSQQQKNQQCVHQGDAGDSSGDGEGVQMDQETVDEAVKEAIRATMTLARQGNDAAREELLALAELTEDGNEEAKKLWGTYGIGGLRGTTDATRKVEWWKQWLKDVLGSKLEPGSRLIYPKKRAGVISTLNLDPMLARRGNERRTCLDVFLDVSGSVPQSVVNWVCELVGDIPGVTVRYYMFDGVVLPLKPGQDVLGGGGTNFQNCVDVVEGRLEVPGDDRNGDEPDAVIMLTDGYAPKVAPADPDKWIWLITPHGDDWPETHNPSMDTHFIDMTE